jgi:hypothetical protein
MRGKGDDDIFRASRSQMNSQFNSYSELMGLPKEQISTEYWFPWYNFAVPSLLDKQFRFGVP